MDFTDETLDVAQLLSYYDASLSLLLRVSQTRLGATHVLNAGLFVAIRDSGIFGADPDIGLGIHFVLFNPYNTNNPLPDIDNRKALTKYFELLLSMLQIINAVVLSRGSENDQTVSQAQHFLHENRPCIVAVFKRNAKIGSIGRENDIVLERIVDNFTVLISASRFLDVSILVEETSNTKVLITFQSDNETRIHTSVPMAFT